MADLAELGYKIDSSQLTKGERALDNQVQAAGRAEKATEKLERQWKNLGKEIGLGLAAIGGVGVAVFGRYIKNTIEAERIQAQLAQRIKSTGGAAGLSAIELNKMADSLQAATTFDDESINEAQALLLTFTKIGRNEFPKATEAILDMATALNTDLKSAALQVGKALNDPVLGVTALARAGVQFSESQKKVIKDLTETGHQAEAQAIILKELESQMGGSARAARDTLGGALEALKNNFDNLLEGESGGLTGTRDAIEDLNHALTDPELKSGIDTLAGGLITIANAALQAAGKIGTFLGQYNTFLADRGFLPTSEGRNMDQLAAREKKLQAAIERAKEWPVIYGKDTAAKLGEELKQVEKQMSGFAFKNVSGVVSSTERRPGEFVPTATGGGGDDKAAKEAEKAAERLKRALNQMADAQREWQGLLSESFNPIANEYAERLNEITEKAEDFRAKGIPSDVIDDFVGKMQTLATALQAKDLAEFQDEFTQDTLEMAAALQGPGATALFAYESALAEVNKQLASGLINQDAYAAREQVLADQRDSSAERVLSDLNMEIEALGKSAEWVAKRNALISAGVTAESEYGQQILATVGALYEQGAAMDKQIALMDEIRSAGSDLFVDIFNGRDAIDSLEDAWERVHQKILQMISENLMDQLFGKQGEAGGGSSGGWLGDMIGSFFGGGTGATGGGTTGGTDGGFDWGSLVGSLFGGGRALGGDVRDGRYYRVGERNRPELLNMGGQQWMIPGDRGRVEPMRDGPQPAANNISITIPVEGRVDRRTRGQIAGEVQAQIMQSSRNR